MYYPHSSARDVELASPFIFTGIGESFRDIFPYYSNLIFKACTQVILRLILQKLWSLSVCVCIQSDLKIFLEN